MHKILSILSFFLIVIIIIFSIKIVSGNYDKQNNFILKIKEIVPKNLQNKLKRHVYTLRDIIKKDKISEINLRKINQGLNGNLILSKELKTNSNKKKFYLKEFFLPFDKLDTSAGWESTLNSKRAHYFDNFENKTIVASGEGEFIFFETSNFNLNKLDQTRIASDLLTVIEKQNFEFMGIRDLLIDNTELYLTVILKDLKNNHTISILRADLNLKELNFEFFFETKIKTDGYSIGTGGRIVNFDNDKLLFSIGHMGLNSEVQNKNNLVGKIVSINKNDKSYEIVSYGHRNPQGLFYFKDKYNNRFILNSEHGPKGGDEINVNYINNERVPNFGWPISSYGINYDGTNPFKLSHTEHGLDEPLIYFTPSIGISEICVVDFDVQKTIYTSSLRANSIYIVNVDKNFDKVISTDRLKFDKRIRDIKYSKKLEGLIAIFEETPSIALIKNYD